MIFTLSWLLRYANDIHVAMVTGINFVNDMHVSMVTGIRYVNDIHVSMITGINYVAMVTEEQTQCYKSFSLY